MKLPTLNIICGVAGVILAPTAGLSQTATTDPVGFITLNVAGTTGPNAALSFKGLSLTRPVEYQGSAETANGTTIVDNEATWTDDQFNGAAGAYYVEIAAGSGAGTTYDIADTVAATKTITLSQSLAAGVAGPVSFKIRKHWTIASVLGPNNEAGFASGDEASVADQLLVYANGAYKTYYHQVAPAPAGGTGWRSADNVFADAGGTVLYPEDGLVIRRTQASALNVVLMGAVKTGQSSIPIATGINILGNVYAGPLTLGTSQLYTGNAASGLASGDESSTADQVLLWNGTGYTTYYYQVAPAPAGGTGWRSSADVFADAANTSIPVGGAFIIRRNGSPFDWKAPQHPASL
jgi:uncharacterized protein (TIGR02597 family)